MGKCSVDGWCGYCYANRRGRESYRGHRWCSLPPDGRRRLEDLEMKKSEFGGPGGTGRGLGISHACRTDFPALVEFMTCEKWDDGSPRKTGSITIFLDTGTLKGCLADRDGDWVSFLTAQGFTELLGALDAGLQAKSLDWRRANPGRKK